MRRILNSNNKLKLILFIGLRVRKGGMRSGRVIYFIADTDNTCEQGVRFTSQLLMLDRQFFVIGPLQRGIVARQHPEKQGF